MVGTYDVVHVQLFACIVKENDPAPLVRNLASLLSKCVTINFVCSTSFLTGRGGEGREGGGADAA